MLNIIFTKTIKNCPFFDDSSKREVLNLEQNKIIFNYASDLYEKIESKFDLICFNAPWIDAPSRNRGELALNDQGQHLVNNFLRESKNYLNFGGFIVLGYSDNSGEDAVRKLTEMIKENNYEIIHSVTRKIQSYQKGRKWMKIFTNILQLKNQ